MGGWVGMETKNYILITTLRKENQAENEGEWDG